MQRTSALCLMVGSLLAIPCAAAAEPHAAKPVASPAKAAIKAPVPIPAQRNVVAVPPPHRKNPPPLAKELFGKAKVAADLRPRAIGSYAKGCLSGAMHLADTGPNWQAMRLSRNRAWGHPKLVKLLQRFAGEVKQDGWNGLLVGDISQPRGGPMLSGHASHQIGLDADVWLTPMPKRVLTRREREEISATSMLDKTKLAVNPKVFTSAHAAVIKRAASYPAVERIFVHPAIKKSLCESTKDQPNRAAWLGKVRPIWGHHYHFHIRIGCPNGGCTPQVPVKGDDGCGAEVTGWLKRIAASLKPPPPPKPGAPKWVPPSERRRITMAQLPQECRVVIESPDARVNDAMAETTTGATAPPKKK